MRKGKIVVILSVLICTITFFGMTPNTAQAEEKATSGDYYGVQWNYDQATQTLTITGNGEIHNYFGDEYGDDCPWWEWKYKTKKIIIGDGITHIGGTAFYDFTVTSVSLPSSVTSIGVMAFDSCSSLEKIILPKGLKKISMEAFGFCYSLKEIEIPDSVNSIGNQAFLGCEELTKVTLPKKLKTIQQGVFWDCTKLKYITIPEGVTKINDNAFRNTGVRSITIPSKVTTLKSELFLDCKYLKTITIKSSKIKNVSKDTFKGVSKKAVIKVPKKKLKTYKKMFYKAGLNCKVKLNSN